MLTTLTTTLVKTRQNIDHQETVNREVRERGDGIGHFVGCNINTAVF